jgi:hypothetical protein
VTEGPRSIHAGEVNARAACLLPLMIALAACGRPLELSVDLRTDLAPGVEFNSVRVELEPAQGASFAPVSRPVRAGEPWWEGLRVADFIGVPSGPSRVRASLLDAFGSPIVTRAVDVSITHDYALTIVLSGSCAGRSCPSSTDPGSFTECLSGRCVDPRCGGLEPQGCGAIGCERELDCADLLGCPAACLDGACVCVGSPRDAGLADASAEHDAGPPPEDAGPPPQDAGSCPGECAPGATEPEARPCGECGEGVEQRSRTCGMDCQWGSYSSWGACETSAQCSPGQTDRETRSCGNCSTGTQSRTRTCSSSTCRWGSWGSWSTCSGGGACAPGATRTGCDPCGHEVCTTSCTWGACEPAPGNACLRIRPGTTGPVGNNYRCCGASRWQFCLDTCQWSTDCATCSSCC